MFTHQSFTWALAIVIAAHQANSYSIALKQGYRCSGAPVGNVVAGPDQGCLTEGAGVALSATISSTGQVDDNFAMVFFSSNNCDPNTEIWHTVDIMSGDEGTEHRCFSGRDDKDEQLPNFGSYQVWDLRNIDSEL